MPRNPREPYGYGQRSGKMIPLRKARYDGIKQGLRDAPEWVDKDHPQRHPSPVFDDPSIHRPLPPNESHSVTVHVGRMGDLTTLAAIDMPVLFSSMGLPSISTTAITEGWGAYGWGSVTGWGGQ